MVAVPVALLLAACGGGGGTSPATSKSSGEFDQLRADLIAMDNPLTRDGDFEIRDVRREEGLLLIEPDREYDEFTESDLEAAVDLCDAVDLPADFDRVEIYNSAASLAEGVPGRCVEGLLRSIIFPTTAPDPTSADIAALARWSTEREHLIDGLGAVGAQGEAATTEAELRIVCQEIAAIAAEALAGEPAPIASVDEPWQETMTAYAAAAEFCLAGDLEEFRINLIVATAYFEEFTIALGNV